MAYVDSVLLRLTEWGCHRFQMLTGATNVWLAVQLTNISIIAYFVWAAGVFLRSGVTGRVAIGVFCAGLLYVLTQTVFKVPIDQYEKAAYQRVAKGLRNPRRLRDAPLRIAFLTFSFILWLPAALVYAVPNLQQHLRLAMLSYLLVILTTILLYVLACDPLPPCPGRVREWIKGFARPRAEVEPEAP
jgi:hypothetical protein